MIFTYDGSLSGLYTALFRAHTAHPPPSAIVPRPAELTLLDEVLDVETDLAQARRLYRGVVEKLPEAAPYHIEVARLSEDRDAGIHLYGYLRRGWQLGGKLDDDLTDPHVNYILRLVRYVGHETHRMLGLLRFKKLAGGVLYASMEPTTNLITLLADHFCDRMRNEDFIIHDVARESALFHKSGQPDASLLRVPGDTDIRVADGEEEFIALWKTYFDNIAIKGRVNPRLQMQFMPKKYWKHLPEMQGKG